MEPSTFQRVSAGCMLTPRISLDRPDCSCSESGWSKRPLGCGIFPLASARYCFFRSALDSKSWPSVTMAWRVLATRMMPEVSRSSRWAGDGLNSPLGSLVGTSR